MAASSNKPPLKQHPYYLSPQHHAHHRSRDQQRQIPQRPIHQQVQTRLIPLAIPAMYGNDAAPAADGEEALLKAESEKPDLILLDVIMPKLNGFQVCRKVKTTPGLSSIKVILCTSKNQESDKFWGKKQGADAYITKPFTDEELLNTVADLL